MWLQLVHTRDWGVSWPERPGDRETVFKPQPFILIKTAKDELVPWTPSQADLLADDWEIA